MKKLLFLSTLLCCGFLLPTKAQDTSLNRYDFAYVGEWDTRHPDKQSLYLVRKGEVVFSFHLPMHDEWGRIVEFDDVKVLPDGNILYAAMSQLGLINRKGEHLWKYVCPKGTESHSIQPMGKNLVYFALNGVPGKILIWNTKEDKMVKEIYVPTAGTNTHGQFRHVRRTSEGYFVTGLVHENKIVELNELGEVMHEVPGHKAWHVDKLPNGNYLIGGDNRGYVRELSPDGKVVWEVTQKDVDFPLYNMQTASRLPNGNTLITNWVAGKPKDIWPTSVQFFEITPDKQVVWKVSSWQQPDLGPCTYLDILSKKPRK